MAALLGGKACMDSLRNDVQDVHWSVADIISRTGPVDFPSWKFPDKSSGDVDMDELLELYDYCEGDAEGNQVAHIGLYELVIDRLVYLLHTMSKFTEQLLGNLKQGGDNSHSTSCSVGLVVKKYCGRLIHLHTLIQQIQSENKSKSRKLADLEQTVHKMNGDVPASLNSINSIMSEQGNFSTSNMSEISDFSSASFRKLNISKDECNKSSQTIETAFIPCESCEVVQKNLRATGDLVVHVCSTQGLPSSLKKFRPQVAGYDWLSANDITRWTHEQNKDLSRINKFVDQIVLEVNPLKAEVTAFEKETKKMEHKVRQIENELKLEKDTQTAIKRQYEIKLQERETTHNETMDSVNRQKEEVIASRKALEKELELKQEELRKQHNEVENLEKSQKEMEREVRKTKVEDEEMKRLENKVKDLNHQLRDVSDQLEIQTKDYNLEISKNKSAQKRNETLQAKQTSLLDRIDQLDRENEEMKEQMNELEEERESIREKLEKLQEENEHLQQQSEEQKTTMKILISEKEKLEKNMEDTKELIIKLEDQVNEARDREKLLVEYPDLNGPVNPDYKGTGNIMTDMENQVKANLIRIQILEKQSEGLQNSIHKFLSNHGQSSTGISVGVTSKKTGGPTQLWKVDNLERVQDDPKTSYRYSNSNFNNSNNTDISPPAKSKPRVKPNLFTMDFDTSQTKTKGEFVVTKTARPESAKKGKESSKQGRPLSSKTYTMAPVNQTSIGAYLQMKKSGHLNSSSRPPSGKQNTSKSIPASNKNNNSDYTPTNMFVCERCDKMYDRERDLEIHQSYCTQ